MVGINPNGIAAGLALFAVSYLLFVLMTPIFQQIEYYASQNNIPLSFLKTMHTLGNYFCLILACASLLYIVISGLFQETNVYERGRY